MPVYVDEMTNCLINKNWKWPTACHMIADTEEELHRRARNIGLKRSWFQKKNNQIPHYDLVETKRKKAIALGTIPITTKEFVRRMRAYRNKKGKSNG